MSRVFCAETFRDHLADSADRVSPLDTINHPVGLFDGDRSGSAAVSNYSPLTVGHRGRIGHSAGRVRRRDGQLALCSTAVPNLAEGEFPQRYSTFGRTSGLPAPLMDSDSAMSLTAESRS